MAIIIAIYNDNGFCFSQGKKKHFHLVLHSYSHNIALILMIFSNIVFHK